MTYGAELYQAPTYGAGPAVPGLQTVGPFGYGGRAYGNASYGVGSGATASSTGSAQALAGTANGAATASGALRVAHPLAGSSVGTAAASGDLTYWIDLAGGAVAVGSATGSLTLTLGLAGSATGQGTATGTLIETLALAGLAAGSATISGYLSLTPLTLAGTSAGSAVAAGDLLVGDAILNGGATGVGTASGALTLTYHFAGTAAGQGTAAGGVVLTYGLTGSAVGVATALGDLHTDPQHLAGSASGQASAAGTLTITGILALAGNASGVSVTAGNLHNNWVLTGTAAGTATATGSLGYWIGISGGAVGQATVAGDLLIVRAPLNDPFAAPIDLVGDAGTASVATIGSTYQPGEPDPQAGSGSVWYIYTPTVDGMLHVSTAETPAPAWQSRVDVYTGDEIALLDSVASGELGSDPQPSITDSLTAGTDLLVTAGVSYRIRVQDAGAARDDAVLNWQYTAIAVDLPVGDVYLTNTDVSTYSVELVASNLPPLMDLTFNLQDGTTLTDLGLLPDTVTTDESGSVFSSSVSLLPDSMTGVPAAGPYNLIVHADSDISLAFTLDTLEEDVPSPLPVAPTAVPQAGVPRWVFQDPTPGASPAQWVVPINPNAMTSPFGDKNLTDEGTVSPHGQSLLFEGTQRPVDWSFSGDVLDEGHYNSLVYWYERPYRVYVIDHFHRAWEVYLYGFDVKPSRTNRKWKHEYTMKARITRGPIPFGGTQLANFNTAVTGATLDTTYKFEGTGSAKATVSSTSGAAVSGTVSTVDLSGCTGASVQVALPHATVGTYQVHITLSLSSAGGTSSTSSSIQLDAGSSEFQAVLFDLGSLNSFTGPVDLTAVTGYSLGFGYQQMAGAAQATLPVNLDDLRVSG